MSEPAAAVVTASYAPDFERCRLLCETLDRHAVGWACHYLLVEPRDVALFRRLEGPRRRVVDERALLPGWLRPFDDPSSLFRRRVWLGLRSLPLRGWHVQQLRRIAIAAHVAEDLLVYCDSDVVFLKPFDCAAFRCGGETRLFRRDGALAAPDLARHRAWSRNAGRALGVAAPEVSLNDYITTLIAWHRPTVTRMCAHIEAVGGRGWVETLGRMRDFSECLLYGRYVDEVLAGAGHFHDAREFCRVHWTGQPLSDEGLRAFVAGMAPYQAAIGLQSFIGTDLGRVQTALAGMRMAE